MVNCDQLSAMLLAILGGREEVKSVNQIDRWRGVIADLIIDLEIS